MRWLLRRLEEAVLGPLEPTVEDLLLLASGGEHSQERLHEMLDWRHQLSLMTAKGIIGTAVGFFLSLLLSAFKAELHMPPVLFGLATVGALLVALVGVYALVRARLVVADYPKLLAQLESLS